MIIEVHYWNQLRDASGIDKEQIRLEESATLGDLLAIVVGKADQGELKRLIFAGDGDHRDAGVSPGVLIDRNGELIREPETQLSDGDRIHLATAISGG